MVYNPDPPKRYLCKSCKLLFTIASRWLLNYVANPISRKTTLPDFLCLRYTQSTGAGIANTPDPEMQMVRDWPEGFRLKRMDCEVGLRVDSSGIVVETCFTL